MLKQSLFSLQGRLGRVPFLGLLLAVVAVGLGLQILMHGFATGAKAAVSNASEAGAIAILVVFVVVAVAVLIPFLWAMISLHVRRLHDADLSGWHVGWVLLVIVLQALPSWAPEQMDMVFAALSHGLAIAFIVVPGTRGPNRYGPPSGGKEPAVASPA